MVRTTPHRPLLARDRPDRRRARAGLPSALAQTAAISKLLGKPLTAPGPQEESSAAIVMRLTQRLQTLALPKAANAYQHDFSKYLFELCWTADEAKGGNVARVPPYPYLLEVCDAFIEKDRLLLSKSRRVLASWVCCCFDIWIAAGGQDPRWPQLMNATGNRQVFVADRKFDSAARFLKRRHRFILNAFRENGGFDLWPTFPTWETKEGEIEFSNNSLISAVAQGSDQLRGPGATLAHLEEIAFWEQAQATVEGMLPIVQGGGHVIAITTPNAASYAKRIVEGRLNEGRASR